MKCLTIDLKCAIFLIWCSKGEPSIFNFHLSNVVLQIACRDYPHPRSACAKQPFSRTPHESYCDKVMSHQAWHSLLVIFYMELVLHYSQT